MERPGAASVTKSFLNQLTYDVIGAAIEVHRALGPGLLESVYHSCLCRELRLREMAFQSLLAVPVRYKEEDVKANLRCDFLVEHCLVVELKATDGFAPIHDAQVLTYMKLLRVPKGILLNFNCTNIFKEGQRTLVNPLFWELPEN